MNAASELFLLDTNIVVAYLRKSAVADEVERKFQLRHRPERPLLSVISVGELWALAKKFGWGERKQARLMDLVRELVVVDINSKQVLESYAELSHWTESRGQKMGQQNDLWIAATAKATECNSPDHGQRLPSVASGSHPPSLDRSSDSMTRQRPSGSGIGVHCGRILSRMGLQRRRNSPSRLIVVRSSGRGLDRYELDTSDQSEAGEHDGHGQGDVFWICG